MSATSEVVQGPYGPLTPEAVAFRALWHHSLAIAAEHARVDELEKEALEAVQELFAQEDKAPDSPEVALLRQRLACIRKDVAALQQRIEEMRQQTPEKDRPDLDRMISKKNELRRYGPDGMNGRWALSPRSEGWLPSWVESLLPSWLAQRSSPSSSEDAEVPAEVGVEMRGPGSATGSAAAGHRCGTRLHARHKQVERQAAS